MDDTNLAKFSRIDLPTTEPTVLGHSCPENIPDKSERAITWLTKAVNIFERSTPDSGQLSNFARAQK
jgi:hypothetical protein